MDYTLKETINRAIQVIQLWKDLSTDNISVYCSMSFYSDLVRTTNFIKKFRNNKVQWESYRRGSKKLIKRRNK